MERHHAEGLVHRNWVFMDAPLEKQLKERYIIINQAEFRYIQYFVFYCFRSHVEGER